MRFDKGGSCGFLPEATETPSMEQADFEAYLQGRYGGQVAYYEERASANKKYYLLAEWLLMFLAAATPILITFDITLDVAALKWIPLATAGVVAILTEADQRFRFHERWVNDRSVCEALKREIHLYQAGLKQYQTSPDREATFVEQVENLLAAESSGWAARRESVAGDRGAVAS